MTIVAKFPVSTGDDKGGKIIIPKGAKGSIIAVSNAVKIKEAFPDLDYTPNGWFYICCFPGYVEEILCDKTQIDVF